MPSSGGRAVFLDRDGVLNRNVFYRDTGAWESPRQPHEFELAEGVLPALCMLRSAGFVLFLVSNQPNAAKGKSPAGALEAMQGLLDAQLRAEGIGFADVFYCTHHPEVTGPCICRKPAPYFLKRAALEHGLSLDQSWMIGDRATDMQCGRAAGARTAWVRTGQEPGEPEAGTIDICGESLLEVMRQILCF